MFAKNCWYVVAEKEQLVDNEPLARTVAGQDLVFYRNSEGKIVGMLDLCPHRLAPLSLGRVEGDNIRCMYHGIVFGQDGQCKEIPGQENIPKTLCAEPFVVHEGHEWIWVWIGDHDKADESLLPNQHFHDPEIFNVRKGRIDFHASYELFNDNTCDLSHVAFVHQDTFADIGHDEWAMRQPVITLHERCVQVDRWMVGIPHPNAEGKVDFCSTFRHELPGVFIMDLLAFPEGTAEKVDYALPTDDMKPINRSATIQTMRPISETSSEFFFSIVAPKWVPEEVLDQDFAFAQLGFAEDKAMCEAQQIMITKYPDRPLRKTSHDMAGAHIRKLIRATHDS